MNSNIKTNKSIVLIYLIIPITSLGVMISVICSGISFETMSLPRIFLIIFCFLLFIGNIIIVWGLHRYQKLIEINKSREHILLKQKIDLESYKQLEEANNRYAQLTHDFNHYIRVISDLIYYENNEELNTLLEKMQSKFEMVDEIEYSNHSILDIMLNDYKNRAEKKNVSYNVRIEPCFYISYVEDMDIVAMLGSLLSNAIGDAVASKEKMVDVKMFMQNDGSFSIIKIQNSFQQKVSKKRWLFPTKTGIYSTGSIRIKKTAEKYNGYLQSTLEKDVLTNVLVLQNCGK